MKLAFLETPKTGFLATRPIWCLLFLLPLCAWVELGLCFVIHSALCSFAIILVKKRGMIVLLHLCSCCLLAVPVPWVGLWSAIVTFLVIFTFLSCRV